MTKPRISRLERSLKLRRVGRHSQIANGIYEQGFFGLELCRIVVQSG